MKADPILAWLSDIGFENYGELFLRNDVSIDILGELTTDDLREMGIKSVGDRRRLLSAIKAYSYDIRSTAEPAADVVQVAQRRMLTVLFCDLVGSTALSARMDPEELLFHIEQFRQTIMTAIAPYDAHIAQYAGDGILAYFGYPRSSDHDAEKAVAASLAVLEAVDALPPRDGDNTKVRIGIATGLTVVGGVDRKREFMGQGAVGKTLNLAARLQSLADPGEIIVAGATRRMIGDTFRCADLGKHHVKGFDRPVPAFKIIGTSQIESRFDALRVSQRQTAFSGREIELEKLKAKREKSKTAKQVVFVSGEGGIGKSRLVREALFNTDTNVLSGVLLQCSPYQTATEFFPLRYQLQRAAGFVASDSQQGFVAKITKLLEQFGPVTQERLCVIADLFGFDLGAEQSLRGWNAHQKRQLTLTHLSEILIEIITRQPVLLVEDSQWMDPSTEEVLDKVLTTLDQYPALVISTSRSSILPEWIKAHTPDLIKLAKLSNEATHAMIRSLVPETPKSAIMLEAIVERSGGVPIFAEELTRNYLASTGENRPVHFLEDIPATLSETLLARLDRLKKGRSISSIAAAIGREFPVAILARVADLPADMFNAAIEELKQAGIIEDGHSLFGEAIKFRQMLVRDSIYQMLLRRDRNALHSRIVATIREDFPEVAEAMPHVLGMQFSYAGEPVASAQEWLRAGTLANQRSAYYEAVQHLRSGLEAIARAQETQESSKIETSIRTTLVGALIAAEGYNSSAVKDEMERAVEAASRFGSTESVVASLFSKWSVTNASIDVQKQIADKMVEVAERGTNIDRLIARRAQATSLLFGAEIQPAISAYHKFMSLYDEAQHGPALRLMHGDHALMVMMGLAEAHTLSANLEEARHWGDRVIDAARKSKRAHDIAHVLAFAGCLHPMLIGDFDRAGLHGQELIDVCKNNGISYWLGHGHLFKGLCMIQSGKTGSGFVEADKGMDLLISANAFSNCWHILYAGACIEHGRIERAHELIGIAERSINQGDVRFAAEFHRIRARLYRAQRQPADIIEREIGQALVLVSQQGSHLFFQAAQEDLDNLVKSFQ